MSCPAQILKFLNDKAPVATLFPKVLMNMEKSNGMTRLYGVSINKKEDNFLTLLEKELTSNNNTHTKK